MAREMCGIMGVLENQARGTLSWMVLAACASDGDDGRSQDAATDAVLGHSTALSGHRVSPLNPRLILFGSNVLMTFQRGVQRIELVAQSSKTGALLSPSAP